MNILSVKDVDFVLQLALDAGFRYEPFEIVICTSPYHTHLYSSALNIDDLTEFIIIDPVASYLHARDKMKSRWLEAESTILTDYDVAYLYARDVIKSMWLEFKTLILEKELVRYAFLLCQKFGHDEDLADLIAEDGTLLQKYIKLYPELRYEYSLWI